MLEEEVAPEDVETVSLRSGAHSRSTKLVVVVEATGFYTTIFSSHMKLPELMYIHILSGQHVHKNRKISKIT